MKTVLVTCCLTLAITAIEGLHCWTCNNAKHSFQCAREGKLQACMQNQKACQNEIRRGSDGIKITKGCAQDHACENNRAQNPRSAWVPSQCNLSGPTSVCRCCCKYDGCNKDALSCRHEPHCSPIAAPKNGRKFCRYSRRSDEIGAVCFFGCNKGFRRMGPRSSTCVLDSKSMVGFFNKNVSRCITRPPPTCRRQRTPNHGSVSCTDGVKIGSVCTYTCDEFHLIRGQNVAECDPTGKWTSIPPACVAVSCPTLATPENGGVSCTFGNDEDSTCTFSCIRGYVVVGATSSVCIHTLRAGVWSEEVPTCERKRCMQLPATIENGYYVCSDGSFFDSQCEFACNDGYKRVGPLYNKCVEGRRGRAVWDNKPPTCEEIRCPDQKFLRNGKVTCTNDNDLDSTCTFECTTQDFKLTPEITSNVCLNDSTWSIPKPCCARLCPPFTVIDLVIMIDSSSSIGVNNWRTIKQFVRELIDTFEIGPDAARIGIFRYNTVVDTASEILLRDYPDNKRNLLLAFDQIPYDGTGTYTGRALRHARFFQFRRGNGNRLDVPDYALVITDGRSSDGVTVVSKGLAEDGVHVLAIGVVPPQGGLDFRQLNDIVSHQSDLIIAESGFDDLNIQLFHDLVRNLCTPGCE